jgi:hypothetical protein
MYADATNDGTNSNDGSCSTPWPSCTSRLPHADIGDNHHLCHTQLTFSVIWDTSYRPCSIGMQLNNYYYVVVITTCMHTYRAWMPNLRRITLKQSNMAETLSFSLFSTSFSPCSCHCWLLVWLLAIAVLTIIAILVIVTPLSDQVILFIDYW